MSASVAVEIAAAATSWAGFQTSQASAAFTPNANRILVAVVYLETANASVTSITGHSTWSKILGTAGASSVGFEVWGCKVGGSPSSSAITVNFTSAIGTFVVLELDANYSGASVAATVVQSSSTTVGYHSAPTSYTATLSAFADATNNGCMYFLAVPDTSGGTTVTPSGSITQDAYNTTNNDNVFVGSMVGENTSPSASSNSGYANHAYAALELDYQGGGGGATIRGVPFNSPVFNSRILN